MYIEKALLTFKVKNGFFPQTLQELADRQPDGSAALLKTQALIDSWGQPYQYDPKQLDPESGTPLIWSDAGEPGNPDRKIANWPEPAPPTYWEEHRPLIWMSLLAAFLVGLVYVRCRYFQEGKLPGWKSRLTQVGIEVLVVTFGCLLVAYGFYVFGAAGIE
jgi:hypothetical protein